MNCPLVSKEREIVVDFCAGSLDSARSSEFEHHMEHCGDCREVVAEQRKIWETLDHWDAPAVSGNFDARLYARIATEEAAPAWRRWVRRVAPLTAPAGFWKPAISLTAACAVLTIGLAIHSPNAPSSSPQMASPQISPQAVDIEQVANALDELDVLSPTSAM